ncbi:hypothetical protein [Mesorhizobium huakuii]|uniref:Uncharacterized protein n=1 Tax=Mesorhizobium huakuii TaxID=28104 RepID=A0A7G6SL45_9HYPH|nr:hypothetical protein [Mesorhizobium huakuii]QND55227.1 hypothetical protein HB778_02665 [Mesorhizobium huakuii]
MSPEEQELEPGFCPEGVFECGTIVNHGCDRTEPAGDLSIQIAMVRIALVMALPVSVRPHEQRPAIMSQSARIEIEGTSLEDLRTMPHADQDALLAFGRPISFTMGSATVLAEFNRRDGTLLVNLAHIDGGGEGVLLVLWKHTRAFAIERQFSTVRWNVHAATCAKPNPRLQRFLRTHEFAEIDDPDYGRIFVRTQRL